jgi:hypothetical protein
VVTTLLVTSAAMLLESAPFILAGTLLAPAALRRSGWVVPYLGCGCGTGPSARSLPAAAAAWLVFGPLVALARLGAAIAVDRVRSRDACERDHHACVLAQLASLTPLALIGAVFALLAPALFGSHPLPNVAFAGAAIAAFLMAPCGIGTVGLAAAMRGAMPAACAGFLCVAGILDLRTWMPKGTHDGEQHDVLAYALAACACAITAARSGAGLVHPKIALTLWLCAAAFAVLTVVHRSRQCARLRLAPAIMLAGTILSAPPPQYHATETMLPDAFAGERIDFTGVVTHTSGVTTLVRYAITCCRADAAPVVLRLVRAPRTLHGWVHARGTLVERASQLELLTDRLDRVDAPADPFVYR